MECISYDLSKIENNNQEIIYFENSENYHLYRKLSKFNSNINLNFIDYRYFLINLNNTLESLYSNNETTLYRNEIEYIENTNEELLESFSFDINNIEKYIFNWKTNIINSEEKLPKIENVKNKYLQIESFYENLSNSISIEENLNSSMLLEDTKSFSDNWIKKRNESLELFQKFIKYNTKKRIIRKL